MHKILIPKIVAHGSTADMECLEHLMIEMIDKFRIIDHAEYERVEHKLYKLVYGEHLNEELAHKWVASMKNKDGSHGEHWTMAQTDASAGHYCKYDWYAILNMMYSDFYNPKFDTTTYIELARCWMEDSDVGDGKTLQYYLHVVCHE